jgi:ATP-dependent DNA helicase RecG
MELSWESPLSRLPGVGPARAAALAKLGLATVGDLLLYYPRDYQDRRKVCPIAAAPAEEPVCVRAMVTQTPRLNRVRGGLELVKVPIADDTGRATVTFFNQSYVQRALIPGEEYVFFGRMEGTARGRQMTNPVFEPAHAARFTGRIMPVYPLTRGVSNNLIASLAWQCVEVCADQAPELLPAPLRDKYRLAGAPFSCANIHFPVGDAHLATARRRLIFEEFFLLSCGMALLRTRRRRGTGRVCTPPAGESFEALLPFPLTAAQRRVMGEIGADMASGVPMNRLVQGDVGSGKTMLAAYGAWLAAKNGLQCALMAPTELLAGQHMATLAPLLGRAGLRVGLLTASVKGKQRKAVTDALQAGELDLLIGTHALISQGVDFARLGLVVADEQHRFGVAQRAALAAKAGAESEAGGPHVLVMSATPIPRTLALLLYGDLDVSVVDELPPGRSPVKTYVVGEDLRPRLYNFIRRLVGEGRQAYVVCPAVEEGEGGRQAATQYAQMLQQALPDVRVELVHGKMAAPRRQTAMAAFAAGEADVLVSTTVIEVGVDVPNAARMVVEDAGRFGLSQLHQLRGRVGRGRHQSYCVLVDGGTGGTSRERLEVLKNTADGFTIAQEDLRLRGPGDFFGQRQHGLPQLRLADLAQDLEVLRQARQAADELLAADPGLTGAEHRALLARIQTLFGEHPGMFN